MGLDLALSSAVSGLMASQERLAITSNNIANASTDGYTRKDRAPMSVVTVGQPMGVALGPVTRSVDAGLQRSLRTAMSQKGATAAMDDIYSRFDLIAGNPTDNNTISGKLNNLVQNFEALAASPENTVNQTATISAAKDVVNTIHSSYQKAVDLHSECDTLLPAAVTEVNAALTRISDLNDLIMANQARGSDITDLQDQRDTAIDSVAKNMGVTYFTRSDGSLSLFSQDGKVLVENSAFPLVYTPGVPTGIVTQTINNTTQTLNITTGKIGGLLTMRNTTLEQAKTQLDNIAVAVTKAVSSATYTVPPATGVNRLDLFTTNGLTNDPTMIGGVSGADPTGQTMYDPTTAANTQGYAAVINVNADVIAHPQTLFAGSNNSAVNPAVPAAVPAIGTPAPGDVGFARAVVTALTSTSPYTFGTDPVTLLPQTNLTLSLPATGDIPSLASAFQGLYSSQQTSNSQQLSYQVSLNTSLSKKLADQSGVNVDSELSMTIQLQNSYQAAAKVITTVNAMFDTLLNVIR